MSGEKREIWLKKFLPKLNCPYPPPQQKSHGQTDREWGKRRIWHVSKCHPSTKWLVCIHHVAVFKTRVLSFKIENNYADKRHKWKEKVQKNAQFPFCGQTRAFCYEIVFQGVHPCFLHGRSERLACFEPTEVCEETWGTFCILYGQGKYVFKRKSLYL